MRRLTMLAAIALTACGDVRASDNAPDNAIVVVANAIDPADVTITESTNCWNEKPASYCEALSNRLAAEHPAPVDRSLFPDAAQ